MADESYREILDAGFRLQCALLSNSGLREDSFKNSQASAVAAARALFNLARPWDKMEAADARVAADGLEAYKQAFGADPNDPDHLNYIADQLAGMRAHDVELKSRVSDSDRINRAIEERERQMRERARRHARK